jgi:hypothetical protein
MDMDIYVRINVKKGDGPGSISTPIYFSGTDFFYVCMYSKTCIRLYMYIDIHKITYVLNLCMHMYECMHMYVYVYIKNYVKKGVGCEYICIYIHMHMYKNVYVYG